MQSRVHLNGLLLAALSACGGPAQPARWEGPPVVVLAVDGLEWSVLEPLMEAGRTPHLAALAERGIAGALATDLPTYSPVLWTSVATGVRKEDHGILHFTERGLGEEPGGEGLPYTSNCRKVPAIWNICGDRGRRVLSVGWWVSWPAEVVPGGRIFASYAAQVQARVLWKAGVWSGGLQDLTFPPALQDEMFGLLQEGALDGPLGAEFIAHFEPVPERPTWGLEQAVERNLRFTFHGDRTHQRIFMAQLEREVADLNLMYVGLADVAGHNFWRYREPEAYSYKTARNKLEHLAGRIDEVYELVDRWVGEVLSKLPSDARVLVLSDHGMHAAWTDEQQFLASGGHDDGPPGVLIAAGPGIAERGLLGSSVEVAGLYDIFPTLLMWLDLPIPEDAVGSARRDWMDQAWGVAHLPTSVPSYGEGYRAATGPLQPPNNANEEFLDGMRSLGYF